jgi:hypothetical protein
VNASHDDQAFDAARPAPHDAPTATGRPDRDAARAPSSGPPAGAAADPAPAAHGPGAPPAGAEDRPAHAVDEHRSADAAPTWHARLQAGAAAPADASSPPTALASALLAALSTVPSVPGSGPSPAADRNGAARDTAARAAAAADLVMRRAAAASPACAPADQAPSPPAARPRPGLRPGSSALRVRASPPRSVAGAGPRSPGPSPDTSPQDVAPPIDATTPDAAARFAHTPPNHRAANRAIDANQAIDAPARPDATVAPHAASTGDDLARLDGGAPGSAADELDAAAAVLLDAREHDKLTELPASAAAHAREDTPEAGGDLHDDRGGDHGDHGDHNDHIDHGDHGDAAAPCQDAGGDVLLAGLGRRFRGATIQIQFELRTTAVRQVFRRDFVYVSQQAHALESSRRVQGIDRLRLADALRAVERRAETIRATLDDAIVQARQLVRRGGGELPPDIRFTRAAALQATIVSPYARLFVDLMRLCDDAISLLEGAWLMGALDSGERAVLINECRRVLVSYKETVREQRHAIGEHVRAVNEERRRARGYDGPSRRDHPPPHARAGMPRRQAPRPGPGSAPGNGDATHLPDDEGLADAR